MYSLETYLKAGQWNVSLGLDQIVQLENYTRLLVEWNQKINLTAIKDPEEIVVKHYLDSLALLQFTPPEKDASVLDVGSGAGFPGIVLKIARPDLQLTCMDGTQKRIHFLEMLSENLGLKGVTCLHARAEEAGRKPELREQFSYVTARAVANLRILSEYCLPFVKCEGRFLAMKGPDGDAEQKDADNAIRILGGSVSHVYAYSLPNTDISRTIIEIQKGKHTSSIYPRAAGKMKKKPL